LASAILFRLKGGAKKTCQDDDLQEDFLDHCEMKWGNNLQ
jgi:hypothetical protein